MRSKIVIQKPTATSIGLIGLDSLLDVYANTVAGDLVVVYPGTYDIGNNSIQLKDGVNWHFFPGVIITSSNAGGTFCDNNAEVLVEFKGEPLIQNSSDLDKRVYLQNAGSVLRGYEVDDFEPRVRIASFTIPAITADTREVITINVGKLRNPDRALIGFFLSTAIDAEIMEFHYRHSTPNFGFKDKVDIVKGAPESASLTYAVPFPMPVVMHKKHFNIASDFVRSLLFVTRDYLKATRFLEVNPAFEKYGASGSAMDATFTGALFYRSYENIGKNVLVGYYSYDGSGCFLLDKKVELESAWLTESDGDTIINIALYNRDASANTSSDLKVAVYE